GCRFLSRGRLSSHTESKGRHSDCQQAVFLHGHALLCDSVQAGASVAPEFMQASARATFGNVIQVEMGQSCPDVGGKSRTFCVSGQSESPASERNSKNFANFSSS